MFLEVFTSSFMIESVAFLLPTCIDYCDRSVLPFSRQKALRALDERLNKTTSQINWPSLEDNVSSDDNSTPAPPTLPVHLSSTSPSSSSIGRHETQVSAGGGKNNTTAADGTNDQNTD